MSARRETRAVAARSANSLGILSHLHEDAVVEVLCAAQDLKTLAALASTSRHLCSLARSRVPVHLCVWASWAARLLLLSCARGRPAFSGCTALTVIAENLAECLLAGGVLIAAQQWPALQHFNLVVDMRSRKLPQDCTLDLCTSPLLSAAAALKQLRCLVLRLPDLGPCSGSCIGQLVQLTRLEVIVEDPDAAADDVRLDLVSWSSLINLKELDLTGVPSVQPAAAAAAAAAGATAASAGVTAAAAAEAGPFCLPSGLTSLAWRYPEKQHPAVMACWFTHLPGCPQLQEVHLDYRDEQHATAHPAAVVQLLAQHNPRLRSLVVCCKDGADMTDWEVPVEGLPDGPAAGGEPGEFEWYPSGSLAALQGLVHIGGGRQLCILYKADWQHMAQMTAIEKLEGAYLQYAPPLRAGPCLSVLVLSDCVAYTGGHDLGRLLLACPHLHTAEVAIERVDPWAPVAAPGAQQLPPHPKLRALLLRDCNCWGTDQPAEATSLDNSDAEVAAAAAAATAAALAQFSALVPVLQGLQQLSLHDWPTCSSRSSSSSSGGSSGGGGSTRAVLPDLSACTALTALHFGSPKKSMSSRGLVEPEQEEYVCMLAPLVQLQQVQLLDAPRVNARVALSLQPLLPQLQSVRLLRCGELLPEGSDWQREQQALGGVMQLLRPGLVLEVDE